MLINKNKTKGFTVAELLVVIVVIAILASVAFIMYDEAQNRAENAKITADMNTLTTAIIIARDKTQTTLGNITGSWYSTIVCKNLPDGTDLAALQKDTSNCWINYNHALDAISTASGMNVRGLVDPWGRPYFIDENENENGPDDCQRDVIAVHTHPFVSGFFVYNDVFYNIPLSAESCD